MAIICDRDQSIAVAGASKKEFLNKPIGSGVERVMKMCIRDRLKTNLTTEMILKKRSMTISVIGMDCPLDTIKRFGMSSGREKEKLPADCARDGQGLSLIHI